ncbi:MAG: amino acid ABC transporter permease [Chloroflexota bacterium]
MTDGAGREDGPVAIPATVMGAPAEQEIVARIADAERRRRLRDRGLFAATWVGLAVAIVVFLGGRLDLAFYGTWGLFILGGALNTILLTVFALTAACAIAVVGALARLSTNPVVNAVASFYVSLIRGTPLIVQIFVWAFGLAAQGVVLPLFEAGVIALAVNYGAYMTEVFRAGIQAVPPGQREAALSLGMPDRLIMRRIVLPQAIRIVIPAIGNDFIAMIKDTSLVFAIGIQELVSRANQSGRQTSNVMEALLFAALIYWVLTLVFSFLQDRLERRMARGDR